MATLSGFDEVIQSLLQDQNLVRIKKLLVYACRNTWISDSNQLSQFNLQNLIQELLKIAPTLEQLKVHLDSVVQTLSKPAEYALVANAIANYLNPLYSESQDSTQVIFTQNIYFEVAQTLEQDPQQIRIKKLLFRICNHVWENDQTKIDSFSLLSLVQKAHQLTPTLDELKAALDSIVKTLNRQTEYALIANKIIDAFKELYFEEPVTQVRFEPLIQTFSAQVESEQSELDQQLDSNSNFNPPEQSETSTDLFDLRLEIMKYTNPLRAKALIFSLLYYSLTGTEDWSILKTHELYDLLQNLLQTYPTFSELESKLKALAKTFQESDQYIQAAGAIIRAVKPFYSSPQGTSFVQIQRETPEIKVER